MSKQNVVVRFEEKLGSGAFGEVYTGKIIGNAAIRQVYPDMLCLKAFNNCEVAVKIVPPFANDETRLEFQNEIDFMKGLRYHPHLVCMLGYVYDSSSPWLLLELCKNGDLLHFVRARKNQTDLANETQEDLKTRDLLSFAWQISNGLEYLTSLDFIHR